MNKPQTDIHSLTCNTHVFDLNARPCIMGILNVTPDSFSDGGRYFSLHQAIQHGLNLAAQGADIIDVGGESTRPGSRAVDADEELRRVLPVVKELAGNAGLAVSIDTMKTKVARQALEAGACMVNDVSALSDPGMASVVTDAGVPVVLMHMPALPDRMQKHTGYNDIVKDIRTYLIQRISAALSAGIKQHNIIIDPGIGFGKSLEEGNFTLLARLREFASLDHPILIGASRKAFIANLVGNDTKARDAGTAAAVAVSVLNGARILRVHNVSMMRPVALVAHSIARFQNS